MVSLVVKDGCRKGNPVAHRQEVGNLKHLKNHSDPCSPEKKHRELQNYSDIECFTL